MSHSRNSRKGAKEGNWKCLCCVRKKQVAVLLSVQAAKREGRIDPEDLENVKHKHFCDWAS